MKVPHASPISFIHHVSVFIFLYIVLQLYPATALPPEWIASTSCSYNNNSCVYEYEGFEIELSLYQSLSLSKSPNLHLLTPPIIVESKQSDVVSINHHPRDVGKTLASHLSQTLISHGLRVGTLETAFVHIAIFSKNYAKSIGLLNELRIMLKTGLTIIPVFYDVKPSDLRCHVRYAPVLHLFRWTSVNNGSLYCKDLGMLEEEKMRRYNSNTVAELRKALFDVSLIIGFERAAFNGDEGLLVHNLIKHVLKIKNAWSIEEPKTPIPYHIFISHRGIDTKNTLASHMYHRLNDSGYRVFFDKEEAQKGQRISSELENAIKVAHVHIVIFSKRYAESEWCMDELLLMVKSHSVIIPVFYDVKRSDIMLVYAEALHNFTEAKTFDPETHKEKPRYDSHTIEMWKRAIMEVTERNGFELETYDGDEGQLVDSVVLEVYKQMKQKQRTGTPSRCG